MSVRGEWIRLRASMFRVFGLIALISLAYGALPPNSASAQDLRERTAACANRDLIPIPSLRNEGLISYGIRARSAPPDRILAPGETYQVSYAIETDCLQDCGDILPINLEHAAVVGAGLSELATSGTIVGSTYVIAHRCGTEHNVTVAFKVPSPTILGAGSGDVATLSLGVCPPVRVYGCAGHTIRVRNVALGEWRVSAPTVRVRTVSGTWPAGRPIPMSFEVSNFSGKDHRPGDEGSIQVRQVGGPGAVASAPAASAFLPNLANGQSVTIRVPVTPSGSGYNSYSVCVVGTKTAQGWLMPDFCGPATSVAVGVRAPGQPERPSAETGGSGLPAGSQPPPAAGAPLPPANLAVPQGGVPRLPVPGGNLLMPGGNVAPAQGVLPPPQAVVPHAVVPQAVVPQAVVPQAAVPHAVAPQPPPAGQLQCIGGEIKGILCWCGIGRFPRSLGGNAYQCQ